jgi:hypothetical protein
MPSQKKQHNFRLSDEQEAELQRLRDVISAGLGGVRMSVTDLVVMGLAELSKKHPAKQKGRK